jgi:hypothetical protein
MARLSMTLLEIAIYIYNRYRSRFARPVGANLCVRPLSCSPEKCVVAEKMRAHVGKVGFWTTTQEGRTHRFAPT